MELNTSPTFEERVTAKFSEVDTRLDELRTQVQYLRREQHEDNRALEAKVDTMSAMVSKMSQDLELYQSTRLALRSVRKLALWLTAIVGLVAGIMHVVNDWRPK
jgi:hypothetical protein